MHEILQSAYVDITSVQDVLGQPLSMKANPIHNGLFIYKIKFLSFHICILISTLNAFSCTFACPFAGCSVLNYANFLFGPKFINVMHIVEARQRLVMNSLCIPTMALINCYNFWCNTSIDLIIGIKGRSHV